MSYENTKCPCGGTKPTDTMLCDDCETAFKDHPSMIAFNDHKLTVDSRRHAAIILVSESRRRSRQLRFA